MSKPHDTANRLVPDAPQGITVDKLKALLPKKTNIAVTTEIVDLINNMEEDTGLPQELMEEDVMSYTHLLSTMKGVGMKDLVNAIKFCNLKRNYENKDAWAITFPDKYNKLVAANKQVDNHVSMYNSSKMVVAIDKELLIPVSLTYAPYFHFAVKKQFEIANGRGIKDKDGKEVTVSPMVQHLAAKELALLTKPLEEQKLAVTVNPGEAALSMQEAMNNQVSQLVALQKQRIDAGEDITDVQVIGISFDDIGVPDE